MTTTKKYIPKLRFPEFEGEWILSELGKYVSVETGNKDTKNKKEEGAYPTLVKKKEIKFVSY